MSAPSVESFAFSVPLKRLPIICSTKLRFSAERRLNVNEIRERAGCFRHTLLWRGCLMSRCCGSRKSGPDGQKALGLILMVAGGLMLLIFVPRWVWTGALSVTLISVGFLLWRF